MIRAKLLIAEELSAGGAELIETWREHPGSRLWLDVEGELTPDIDALLRGLGCEELAILDASRVRHPPKVEEFENNTFVLFRGISSLGADLQLTPQQLALFVGNDFLVTLHRGKSVSINHFWKLVDGKSRHLADTGLLCLQILHFAGGRYLESILDFEDRLWEVEDVLLSGEPEKAMK